MADIAKKLDQVPFDQIGANLNSSLAPGRPTLDLFLQLTSIAITVAPVRFAMSTTSAT